MATLAPSIIQRIVRETVTLNRNPPEDIAVLLNENDVTDIQAVIRGPAGTPYEGGYFQMRLQLSDDFPISPPKGFFVTKIFHPNVAANGAICVNTLKRDWQPNMGIETLLLTIKCLLIVPNPESALNEEAGRLLLEAYDDYADRAKLMTSIHATREIPGAVFAEPKVEKSEDVEMSDGESAPATAATTTMSAGDIEAAAVAALAKASKSGAQSSSENTNTRNVAGASGDADDAAVLKKVKAKKADKAKAKKKKGIRRL